MFFKIFPELMQQATIRKKILSALLSRKLGRRTLANQLNETERAVRKECDVLKEAGFLSYDSDGMEITDAGVEALDFLTKLLSDSKNHLEMKLLHFLGIKDVVVVPGNDFSGVGFAGARLLKTTVQQLLSEKKDVILGLTGGSTVEKLVNAYEGKFNYDIVVVSARGGIGNRYEYQSNTLSEILAKKIGGRHLALQMQDDLSESMVESIRKEPSFRSVMDAIERINVLVFGIGRADVLANRRSLPHQLVDEMIGQGAVAEAFGHYFDSTGNIVREISTVGISLQKFELIDNVIGVASGANKAEAIIAVSRIHSNLSLVTDEAAANKIIEIFEKL